MSKKLLTLILVVLLATCIYVFSTKTNNTLKPYFPLNENDQYVYQHEEGPESSIVTITVKNVKHISDGTEFDFLFQGQYNDRIQTSRLTAKGLLFCRNKHLVGQVPMKVIREFSPPILLLPYKLEKSIAFESSENVYDYDGKLIDKEKIEAIVSFVGFEEVNVEAGRFKCRHFFVKLNYEDQLGNSTRMHAYNFWVVPGLGYVKVVHTYTPFASFAYFNYIKPEDKTIMNRYNSPFTELLELKKAVIAGKGIGR